MSTQHDEGHIRPCPFCGGKDVLCFSDDVSSAIACRTPECCTIGPNADTAADALVKWNKWGTSALSALKIYATAKDFYFWSSDGAYVDDGKVPAQEALVDMGEALAKTTRQT